MTLDAPRSDRNAALDLLRLVAALSVVGFHFLFRGAAGVPMMDTAFPEAAPLAIYGYLGVNLFFLISGYVIAWSAEGRSWHDFAIARFARLYPGFIVCMTVTFVVLTLAASSRFPVSLVQYGANLAMFAPALGQPFMDGVYWSIVLELVFYFWVALALIAGVFHGWKLELVAAWLVVCMVNEYAIGSGALRMLFVTEFGPLFAAGILLHHIRTRGVSAESAILVAASFVLSASLMGVSQGWMQASYGVSVPTAHLVLANAAMHALLALAIWQGHRLRSTPTVLALGGLTYPLYLLHQNIGYVAIDTAAPVIGRWVALVAVTALMIAVSWAIWRFVETPLRRATVGALKRLAGKLPLVGAGSVPA